jgi:hypothetical protein
MSWVAKLSEACGLFSAFATENHPLQTAIRIPDSQAIQRARHAGLPPPIDPLNARRRPRRNAVVACDEGPGERGVKGGGRGVTDVGLYIRVYLPSNVICWVGGWPLAYPAKTKF